MLFVIKIALQRLLSYTGVGYSRFQSPPLSSALVTAMAEDQGRGATPSESEQDISDTLSGNVSVAGLKSSNSPLRGGNFQQHLEGKGMEVMPVHRLG